MKKPVIKGLVFVPNSFTSLYCYRIQLLRKISFYDKIYIYSPTTHQHLYQKTNERFSNYIPIKLISKNVNEEDKDLKFDEIVKDEHLE